MVPRVSCAFSSRTGTAVFRGLKVSLAQCLRALARVVRLEIWGSRTGHAVSCQSAGGARLGRQENNFTLFNFVSLCLLGFSLCFNLYPTLFELCLNLVSTLFPRPCLGAAEFGAFGLSASPCLPISVSFSHPASPGKPPIQPYRPCQTNGTKGFVRFCKPYRYALQKHSKPLVRLGWHGRHD